MCCPDYPSARDVVVTPLRGPNATCNWQVECTFPAYLSYLSNMRAVRDQDPAPWRVPYADSAQCTVCQLGCIRSCALRRHDVQIAPPVYLVSLGGGGSQHGGTGDRHTSCWTLLPRRPTCLRGVGQRIRVGRPEPVPHMAWRSFRPVKFYSTEAAPAICWSRLGWRGGTSQSTFEMGKRHATEHTHLRLARLCRERTRRGGVEVLPPWS